MKPKKDDAAPAFEICILAGGLSARMGRDKAGLRLGRRTLLGEIRHQSGLLGLPVRVIRRDRLPRCGPLGGIFTALKTSRAKTTLFLTCDMPFVTPRLLRRLLRSLRPQDSGVVTENQDRAGFPCALRRETLGIVTSQIESGALSLRALADAARMRRVHVPPAWAGQLLNINTPDDWQEARQLWTARTLRESGKKPCPAP